MKKNQLVELVKNALALETKKEAEGFLAEVDAVMEALANGLEVGDKAKLGNHVVVEKVHVEAKEGVAMGKPYKSEAKDVLKIKLTATGKSLTK